MNPKEMTIAEVEARLSEIRSLLDKDESCDVESLTTETDALLARKAELRSNADKRAALAKRVAVGDGVVTKRFAEAEPEKMPGVDSPEYRTAYFKSLLGKELTDAEQRTLVTGIDEGTKSVLLPTQMLENIWNLVKKQHSLLADVTIYRTGVVLEVLKHIAITKGAAAKLNEAAAPADEEENSFVKVTLSGKDFSKYLTISYAMEKMSIDALENYLSNEIADSMGDALSDDIVAMLEKTTTGGASDTNNGILADNVYTVTDLTFPDLAKAFGKLKHVNGVTIYTNRETLYNYLVAMVDSTGRPIFQPSVQAGAEGVVLGARIKIEESITGAKLLIGDPSRITYNMVQDIIVEKDKDIKTHTYIYSGYARGEGALIDPASFVELTINGASGE